MNTVRRLHALSIDVEDWYHPELIRGRVDAATCARHAPEAARAVLELLARRAVQATFFVLGEVAQDCPDLVREIASAGHELGCHTFSHRPLWELTPATLAAELDAWRRTMRAILGPQFTALGFRAPTFSLDERTAWAIDVLVERGYRYDSSIFPFKNYLYGVAGAPDAPYRISSADLRRPDRAGRLVEFPMSVCRLAGLPLPVSGGVYLRALPLPLLSACLRRIERERPFVIYAHPWELSPTTPRVRLPALEALATYYNRGAALQKLDRLLGQFEFAPIGVVLARSGLLG